MIKIGILGKIGSGKSYISKMFGCPVFNADKEVSKIYNKDRSCYGKLKKKLKKYIKSFPINKKELSKAILDNRHNLKREYYTMNITKEMIFTEFKDATKKDRKTFAKQCGLTWDGITNF